MFFKIKNINKEVANDTFVIEMFEEAKVELFRTMRYQVFCKLCDTRYFPNYAISGTFQTMRYQGIFRSIHYSMLDNGNFQAMLFPNYEYKV